MRVVLKDCNENFLHLITPRNARLLLKNKKAVIESKSPFTIRLTYTEHINHNVRNDDDNNDYTINNNSVINNCVINDSTTTFLSQQLSDNILSSEKDISSMCENNYISKQQQKNNSKTHLLFGHAGSNISTLFQQFIFDKINNRDEDVVLFGNQSYPIPFLYPENEIKEINNKNKFHQFKINDIPDIMNDVSPTSVASSIVNFYIETVGNKIAKNIAIDDHTLSEISLDYDDQEYFRELSKECKKNNLNLIYSFALCFHRNKNEYRADAYSRLPTILRRFADIITVVQ